MSEIVFQQAAVAAIQRTINARELFGDAADSEALRDRGLVLIDTLDEVERFQDPDWPDARIDEPMNWNDILGDTGDPYLDVTRGHSHEEKQLFTRKIDAAFEQCKAALERNVTAKFGEKWGPEVVTEVYNILQTRAACGLVQGSLTEELWDIMLLGGYPCGWCGGQDGCLVVYIPPDQI